MAQRPSANLEAYRAYTERAAEILRKNPQIGIEDLQRQLGADPFNTTTVVTDKDLVEESRLLKGQRNLAIPAETAALVIKLFASPDDIHIRESKSNDIGISVEAFSSTSREELNQLLAAITLDSTAQGIAVSHQLANYYCIRQKTNSTLKAQGGCYNHITIDLPAGSKTVVRAGNGKRLNQLNRPSSDAEIIAELAAASSLDRFGILREHYAKSPSGIATKDWPQVLGLLSSLNREEAITLLASKAVSLPVAEVSAALAPVSSLDKLDAFKALAPKVPKTERMNLLPVITQQISSLDRDEAISFLQDLLR